MAKQTINIGSSANDGTVLRLGFGDLINDNFNEIYTAFSSDGSNLSTTVLTIVDESSTESTITYGERDLP